MTLGIIRYKSVSQTREVSAHEVEFFEKQWAGFTTDPYYNEAMLKKRGPNYEIVPSRQLIG